MLEKQCFAVNQLANGELEILNKSGFQLNKVREKRPVPSKGTALEVKLIAPKCAEFHAHGIVNSNFIELEIDGPDGFCKVYSSTKTKVKVSDLPVGVELKACVRGVNGNGAGEWSETVTFMVYGSTQHNNAAA